MPLSAGMIARRQLGAVRDRGATVGRSQHDETAIVHVHLSVTGDVRRPLDEERVQSVDPTHSKVRTSLGIYALPTHRRQRQLVNNTGRKVKLLKARRKRIAEAIRRGRKIEKAEFTLSIHWEVY